MLTDAERKWLNNYHARVRQRVEANLDADSRAWLVEATRSI
jgi:Xaa-Pro aminopeptidase